MVGFRKLFSISLFLERRKVIFSDKAQLLPNLQDIRHGIR